MKPNYSNSELTDMLLVYGECYQNGRAARRRYKELYPERRLPSGLTFLNITIRARETGNMKSRQSFYAGAGGCKSMRTVLAEERILEEFEKNPKLSIRKLARLTNASSFIVHKVLKEADDNGLRASNLHYSPKIISLSPKYFPSRMKFCYWLLEKFAADENFFSEILFADEVRLTNHGILTFNNQNSKKGSGFNINVWIGILNGNLLGPFILPDCLDEDKYLNFLQNDLPPLLEEIPLNIRQNMWFMHHGESSHFGPNVLKYLDNTFPKKLLSSKGPIFYPLQSPDLNPVNFYFWKFLKSLVYTSEIFDVEDLKTRIIGNSHFIQQHGLHDIQDSLIRRAHMCIQMNGAKFQQML